MPRTPWVGFGHGSVDSKLNLGKSGYGFYIWHDENGHYVEDITIGSPADRAGLRAGDRIIEINNGE